ncbi:phosphotransferase [Actinomadura gamaensis]|uniref:Phosphotransferase n=1 Tax=Actinomadura gamaensis TaxID=1763541 RepID=A0ABV9U791_9ACTN
MRAGWGELPGEITRIVKEHAGTVAAVVPAAAGNHADIASTVTGSRGRVFIKAARKASPETDGPEARSLRWEKAINPHVAEFAPQLLHAVETDEWIALIFEHVDGRKADHAPGSPDLLLLAKTIHALQATPCPAFVQRQVERRWTDLGSDASPMAGTALLHTDLNTDNLIITGDRVHVVDWAFVSRGAAWVELAQLVPWLLGAGHTPQAADEWLAQFPSWLEAPATAIDLHAQLHRKLWEGRLALRPEPWMPPYVNAVRQWATHRQ